MGEFGLSLLADSRIGESRKRVLVDFGADSDAKAPTIPGNWRPGIPGN